MNDFVVNALGRELSGAPGWLTALNRQGRTAGAGKTLPTIRTEDWKYTSLRPLQDGGYAAAPEPLRASVEPLATHFEVPDLDALCMVFVNGQFSESLSSSDAMPEGVSLVPFSRASEAEAALIGEHLDSLANPEGRLFTALNDSWLTEGLFLRVAENVRIEKPLQLVWLTTAQGENFGFAQRLLVLMEQGSEATVIEHFTSTDEAQNAFCNGVTELVIGADARLDHYRLHLEEAGALHVGNVCASLDRNARLNGFHMALGGRLKRIDLAVRHRGEGSHCELNGVYLPRNREHVDYHTVLEHEAPHTSSEETFRGIVADQARAVFNGRIHIHPGAQKTQAHLTNRNLLTSNQAEVDTKPELEIYADDVQCSHGATVAQLDASQLHYLRTRGVSEQEARVLLNFGFINELLNRAGSEPVRQYLRPRLASLFARDPNLTRHLL